MDGINNKIKVSRQQAYGLLDDDYFFQRLFDARSKNYVRTPYPIRFVIEALKSLKNRIFAKNEHLITIFSEIAKFLSKILKFAPF